ncbi:hypothetical protein LOY37_16620 [Pseudomonas sp. B21-012]|uniref:hypothetical protein n=1 Tax=Pseudomonas sp. B21-012 TaxID=2895472 RepID=UPI0021608358|nr:hypothetical protein [Pseudomonas sp. B21-012]UVM53987.1 hypothetical protein LOY37_16620 [Pseudomonas sp. B21-012]
MSSIKTKVLMGVMVMALLPALSWAKDFECSAYDLSINGGKGADARQTNNEESSGSNVTEAEKNYRASRPDYKDPTKFSVSCVEREVEPEE